MGSSSSTPAHSPPSSSASSSPPPLAAASPPGTTTAKTNLLLRPGGAYEPISYLRVFCHARTRQGLNLYQFCQRYGIAPHVRYAVASRKNTDSLVKGMIMVDQGGGGRGGGERSWSKVLPPVSLWSACFSLFFSLFEF